MKNNCLDCINYDIEHGYCAIAQLSHQRQATLRPAHITNNEQKP